MDLDTMSADLSSPHQAKSCLNQKEVREEIIDKLEQESENFEREELKEIAIQASSILNGTEEKLTEIRKENIVEP